MVVFLPSEINGFRIGNERVPVPHPLEMLADMGKMWMLHRFLSSWFWARPYTVKVRLDK
jgi:hypothetical protein